jgi:acyl-CoA synthetase (NDP forming)
MSEDHQSLDALLRPRSIAVLGASERSALGRWIVESLGALGFAGPVLPVNPKYSELLGQVCYPSFLDLPEAPDVAAMCIGRAGILENLELLARRGGRGAVIYDSGFAELGEEGRRLQDRITGLCAEAGIALCGPNCMGILNPQGRSSTFKQTVRGASGLAGSVGLVSQSGSICGTMLADLRRFGFSLVISGGNEAAVSTASYIDYLVDDPDTKAIATFTETIREPERYIAALDRAAALGKPVIVLKVGRSERTRRAITSHTGGLAGESRVFSEVLKAHRAIEVFDLNELTEVLAACQGAHWPKGPATNVLATSGGQAELILDIASEVGVDLAPLPEETRVRIEREVGHITGDGNPLDAWGNGDVRVNMPPALTALAQNPGTDVVVFCSSDSTDDQALGRSGRELDYAQILADAARASTKPHYLMTMRSGIVHRGQVAHLAAAGVPVISGARQGLQAIQRLARWMRPLREQRAPVTEGVTPLPSGRRVINEFDSKVLLAAAGLPVTRERLAHTPDDAARAARELGFPVVIKVVSDDIPHKSEHGLVAVGVENASALQMRLERMAETAARLEASLEGWLVQEMVTGGIEVFAGVSRDPDFGLALAFGMGGVAIEALHDFSIRMLPLRDGDAEDMIAEIRNSALLRSVRGRPASDVAALARCLYGLADFATTHGDQLAEIDLNPIKVREEGHGCVIVDALIVARDGSTKNRLAKRAI